MDKHYAISIDGPAGAGKTSTAKQLAHILWFRYIDTGMFYRALAFACLLGKFKSDGNAKLISPDGLSADQAAVTDYFTNYLTTISADWTPDGSQVIVINGEPFWGPELRQEHVSQASSVLSTNAAVRSLLLSAQQNTAAQENCVMEGRDIGTVVLPNADCKIFLTAKPEIRAKRRIDQDAIRTGIRNDTAKHFQTVLDDILIRDERDRTRTIAPLTPAADSILVDNGGMTQDETVRFLISIVKDHGIPVPEV